MRAAAEILLVVLLASHASGAIDHYARAAELARSGKYTEALQDVQEAARQDEKNPKVQNLLGVVLSQLGRFKEANQAYSRALALAPAFYPARKNRASNAFFLKDFNFAASEFDALRKLQPNDYVPPLFLGLIAMERADYAGARAHLTRSRKLAPSDGRVLLALVRMHFMLAERAAALQAAGALETQPDMRAAELFELGVVLAGFDANDRATAIFTRLAKQDPASYDAAYNLALVELRAGNVDAALASSSRLASGWPQAGEVWNLRGRIFARAGRKDDAVSALRKAIAVEPAQPENYLDLSTVLMNAGDSRAAEQMLREGIDHSSAKDRLFVQLGILNKQNRDLSAAKSWYRKALEVNPANEAAYIALAHIHLAENQEAEAISVLEQGSGRVPDSALIAYVYGSLLFETAAGDAKIFERARAALEKSRALNPLFANTYYRLARMQLKSGDPDQAKALFEKAIALNPKNAQAMYQLSLLLARQGDKKRAAELRTAVQQVHAERDSLLQEMASQPAGQSPDAGLKKPGPAAH